MKPKYKALLMGSILALSACDLGSQEDLQEDSEEIQNQNAWATLGQFAGLNPVTSVIFGVLDIFANQQPDYVALLNQAVADIKMEINTAFMNQAIQDANGALSEAWGYYAPCKYPNGQPSDCTASKFALAGTEIISAKSRLLATRGGINSLATAMMLVENLVTTSNVLLEVFMLDRLVTYPNNRRPRRGYLASFHTEDLVEGARLANFCKNASEAVGILNTMETTLRSEIDSKVHPEDVDAGPTQIRYCFRTEYAGGACGESIPLRLHGRRAEAARLRDQRMADFKAAKFQEFKDKFMGGYDRIKEKLIMRSRCEPSVPFPATGETCFGAGTNVLRRGDKVATMQSDGNFVVYRDALPGRTPVPLWGSGTEGPWPGRKLCLRADGRMTITNREGTISRTLSPPNPAAKMLFLGVGGGLYVKDDADTAITSVAPL